MKRIFCLILSLSVLLCCACSNTDESATNNTTENTTASPTQTVTPTVPEQKPMVSVALPVITEETKVSDGTVVFRHTYQTMELIVPDPDIADTVILDFISRTDSEDAAANLAQQAMNAYSANSTNWTPHLTQTTYAPKRIDTGILSLFGCHATFTGGAHAEAVYRSMSYDLVNGKAIALDDVLTDSATKEVLIRLVTEALTPQKENGQIWEGYEEAVKARFTGNYLQDKDWFFSDKGLCFFFPPYEIGPYASGAIVAQIPYEKLTGSLEDAYFPTEFEPAYGKLEATVITDANLNDYTQISEVILSETGTQILLHTEYSVNNVRLDIGQWSADGANFTVQHTVFYAMYLTPGDAVMVAADFTETLPAIRVTYESNEGTVQEYITYNGTNKTVILIR